MNQSILVITLLLGAAVSRCLGQFPNLAKGKDIACDQRNGTVVNPEFFMDSKLSNLANKCIVCRCHEGFIKCANENCPGTELVKRNSQLGGPTHQASPNSPPQAPATSRQSSASTNLAPSSSQANPSRPPSRITSSIVESALTTAAPISNKSTINVTPPPGWRVSLSPHTYKPLTEEPDDYASDLEDDQEEASRDTVDGVVPLDRDPDFPKIVATTAKSPTLEEPKRALEPSQAQIIPLKTPVLPIDKEALLASIRNHFAQRPDELNKSKLLPKPRQESLHIGNKQRRLRPDEPQAVVDEPHAVGLERTLKDYAHKAYGYCRDSLVYLAYISVIIYCLSNSRQRAARNQDIRVQPTTPGRRYNPNFDI